MAEEKKPISKSSTVTIGFLVILIPALIFIGVTIQTVKANSIGVKENQSKIENLVTKDDLTTMKEDLIRFFSK